MSNYIAHSVYASLFKNPDDEFAVNFYVYLHEDVANQMINSHPKLTEDGKKSLLKKVSAIRAGLIEKDANVFDAYQSANCAALFKVNYEGIWTEPWADKFVAIYRGWKYATVSAGGTIMLVPGSAGNDPDALEKAFADEEKEVNDEYAEGQKETAPESSGKWRPMVFEENIPKEVSIQILDWARTLYPNLSRDEFQSALSAFAILYNLEVNYTEDNIYVTSANKVDFFKNEKIFIERYRRFSKQCSDMMNASPPQYPDEIQAMAEHLEKVLQRDEQIRKKREEEMAENERKKKMEEELRTAMEMRAALAGDANKLLDEYLKDHPDKDKAVKDEKVMADVFKFATSDAGKKFFTMTNDDGEITAILKEVIAERVKGKETGSSGGYQQSYSEIRSEGVGTHDPKFVEALELPDKMKEFLKIPLPGKVVIGMTGEKFKNYKADVAGVRAFLKENGHDETDLSDVVYGVIVTELIEYGAIMVNDDSAISADIVPAANTQINPFRIKFYKELARRVVDASMFYMCQGARGGTISWYESFKEVSGTFLSEKRFMALCDQVINSGFLTNYVKTRRVSYIRSVNNLFKYRLTRMSTPSLIFRALGMVNHPRILRMISADQLAVYYRFYKAGILAQIASGPLKSYLTGSINCLKTFDISGDVLLGELAAIEEPPFIPRIIKQAKAILDVHKVEINRWYQGEKAWATADNTDISFKAMVSAIRDAERDKLDQIAKDLASESNVDSIGSDDNIKPVREMVASKDNF